MKDPLVEQLRAALAGRSTRKRPVPRFAPELNYGRQRGPAPHTAKRAAVLALLYPDQGGWSIPLIVRPRHMASHAGQISLPGGLVEPGETTADAARREFAEELGEPPPITLLGRLSECYVYVSDFRITPWVGVADSRPAWRPNPAEVDQVLAVPLDELLLPASAGSRFLIIREGITFHAPYFGWHDHKIWGATASILAELLASIA